MELKQILQGCENIKAKGDLDLDIKDITNDSRKVKDGTMFIAIKGFDVDGHEFLKSAVENGACCVMVQEGSDLKKFANLENVTIIAVPDTRKALAIVSSNFYGNPARQLKLIGVTGTKGKTTTTYMIKNMLEAAREESRINSEQLQCI